MRTGDSFECVECGRQQSYAPAGRAGGVTEEEAEMLGWRTRRGDWYCPFCSGNARELRKVVEGRLPGLIAKQPAGKDA